MSEAKVGPQTVFVSYAREDREAAFRLASALEQRGIAVWIDRRIRPGSRWDQEIQRAIVDAGAMLVLLSKSSVNSSAVHDEFSLALDDGDLVIPLLLETCEVPLRLRSLQWLDFSDGTDAALEELVARLREHGSTVNPTSLSQRPEVARAPGRKPGIPVLVALGALMLAGALVAIVRSDRFATQGARTASAAPAAPSAHPSPANVSASADPPASARPDTKVGDELLEQYRTVTDSRSRRLNVKSRWSAAAESFQQAFAALPAADPARGELTAKAAFARGRTALLEGRLDDAERDFRAAASARADWASPHIELVTVYTRLGRYAQAHTEARSALALDPDFWLAQTASGSVYAAEGKLLDSISVYEAALAEHDVPLIRGNLALAYHAARLHDERALVLAREALKRDPDLPSALTVVAEHELERGRALAALESTQRMVDLDVFDVRAWLVHGDALLALGRLEPARAALTRAVELFEQSRQTGAPPERLKQVASALAAGKLPPPRPTGSLAGRSAPAKRPPPRSIPEATRPPRSLPEEPLNPGF